MELRTPVAYNSTIGNRCRVSNRRLLEPWRSQRGVGSCILGTNCLDQLVWGEGIWRGRVLVLAYQGHSCGWLHVGLPQLVHQTLCITD